MAEPASFSDVDAAEVAPLVAMMAATDDWPAVQAARAWTLLQAGDAVVRGPLVDVGCGPGAFGALARAAGWATVELDRSAAMLGALATAHDHHPSIVGDVCQLPLRHGSVGVARCERVLQWTDRPDDGVAELWRATAPGGWVAVTDTDWSTLTVEAPTQDASAVLAEAALGWVPHPTLAATLHERLRSMGAHELRSRVDRVELARWDPDDPAQHDGPPGLPLHSIAAGAPAHRSAAAVDAVAQVASAARTGRFAAGLTLVTVLARR